MLTYLTVVRSLPPPPPEGGSGRPRAVWKSGYSTRSRNLGKLRESKGLTRNFVLASELHVVSLSLKLLWAVLGLSSEPALFSGTRFVRVLTKHSKVQRKSPSKKKNKLWNLLYQFVILLLSNHIQNDWKPVFLLLLAASRFLFVNSFCILWGIS